MGNLKDKYAIVGVGLSEFGKIWDKSPIGFTLIGIQRALEDAGLSREEVDGLLVAMPAMMGEEHGWASRIAALLELSTTWTFTMDCGGATPVAMVQCAAMAIEAGMCHTVVCAYGHSENPQGAAFAIPNLEFTMPYGDIGAAALQAHIARRHMHLYGTTSEQLGAVAVIVPQPGSTLTPQQLHAWAHDHIAAYKCPRKFILTDAIPMTFSFKPKRNELRKIYENFFQEK